MPIFEYVCEDCGTKFEKLVRNGASVACPGCGQDHLKQQFSTFAAKAADGSAPEPHMGGCGAGMCRQPDVCGRN
ncbi:MAG TPA: zinc ribbon domain-containing protein [Bryobacteraceae bacterium]|jgi:putative FmdB family regulatory protein|nr:zinc ribbon domain-containing protein [Bryobacteraceae bacterium]